MHVRTMPTVNFKKTKKTLAKKNDQYYYSGHRSKTHAAQLLNKLTAMHAPAEMPKSEGEPRKTAAATDKARKKAGMGTNPASTVAHKQRPNSDGVGNLGQSVGQSDRQGQRAVTL